MSETVVLVYSQSRLGKVGGWSRYIFPFSILARTQLDGELLLRAGDTLYAVDEDALDDAGTAINGVVWYPFLDMGQPGGMKQLVGVDVVAVGTSEVSIGYDQTNAAAYTTPFAIPADTVPGMIVPICVTSPSMALKLTFDSGQAWELEAVNMYVNDMRPGA